MEQITLMYHCVYEKNTSESGFQNETALKYKVQVASFENQVSAISNYLVKKGLSMDTVVFTFDDGGISFLTLAAPILEKYGFRGIFFISTSYIGTKGFLSSDQVRELAKRGHIIGSHSHTHPQMMNRQSKEELDYEWEESQRVLGEILGKSYPLDHASIPNGFSSPEVIQSMQEVGIKNIYTSAPTTKIIRDGDDEIIGRYAITDDRSTESVLSIVTSPTTRRKIALRNSVLGAAKTLLGPAYLKIRDRLLHNS